MKFHARVLAPFAALTLLALGSCGGGGGSGEEVPLPPEVGVFTGFPNTGNLEWESTGGDGTGGVGDGGASGDGGVGAGGDFGQFRGANVCVFLDDGTRLGCALTDDVKGMVTIKPGRDYRGGLRIELSGTPTATYYEEGRDTYVPFPADRKIRVWVPSIQRNIGITPFTEAAYRLLTEGTAPESAGTNPTKDQIRAANERVRQALNEHFPSALHVDDIARLPFIKSQGLPAGSMRTDPRGRYGLVNGAFSKQASFHNSDTPTPTLDAVRQLAEDLLDGRIDGRNGDLPAGPPEARTYDPNTLTSELSSALAEQAARFGAQEALDVLPRVLNFGNVRYEGYLFDGSISTEGRAFSTVAGWVAGNEKGFSTGQRFDRLPGQRALAFFGNNGHGGGFYKADALGPRHKVYAIGDNVNGELGLGTRDSTRGAAVEVNLPGAMTHAAGGFAHTVMRLADGRVFTWGDNSFGQLGQGQGPGTLPSSLVPLRVQLPRPALAVAATNVASYALLDDGTVWAWGSNGGFGLLGNGQRDGGSLTPAAVTGLTQVAQISARDNDVVVLRRDNTLWQWGSSPAAPDAVIPGDVSGAYAGGHLVPTQIAGLPAGVPVRKVITEQGLFAVLLANGHVYHWGVHFDLSANEVLRDLQARRVFGLPPVRDLMPGGFIGYGSRPFDRLTAMAVDYSGGMWKVRGRVAERFETDNPAAQRRPKGAARPDCETCHTFLDESIEQLRARQPSTAGAPVCEPPTQTHSPGGTTLIHAETECILCHNPSRANYPALAQPFADTGFWPNCSKPASLPPRTSDTPPLLTNSCTLPVGHSFTPPGTVCASCHNSVIARPLQSLDPPCAQPGSAELPSIPTTINLTGAFAAPGGTGIAAGGFTPARRYELRGTLGAALTGAQSVQVLRNGSALGTAVVNGTNWSFTLSTDAPEGLASHAARVVAGAAFGATSNTLAFTVDATPPTATAAVTGFVDDVLGTVGAGGFASDTTPMVQGTLSAPPGSGEVVRVLRNGSPAGLASVSGTTWSFSEPAALGVGSYSYAARVEDAAGNLGSAGTTVTLNIVAALAGTTISQITTDAGVVVAPGASTSDSTPTLAGTLSAGLPAGQVLRVRRNGTLLGNATVNGTTWTFTDPGAPEGEASYAARVEAGAIFGAEATYSIVVDTLPPTQTTAVTMIADDFNGDLAAGATTADTTPIVRGTLSAPLATGERLRLLRNATTEVVLLSVPAGATAWSHAEANPLANGTYTYTAQVVDAAGLLGPVGTGRTVTINAAAIPLQNAATTLATINGVAPSAGAVPPSNDNTPTLAGTIQRVLAGGEVVRIYRGLNGAAPVAVATATVTGTSWTYTSPALPDGNYAFRAQIEQAANAAVFGLSSATIAAPIDTTPPGQTATLTTIYDNSVGLVNVTDTFTTDTTPRLDGTVSPALTATDFIRILRNGAVVATIRPAGTTWSYVEPAPLALGTYNYTVDVRDDAGNPGSVAAGATRSVQVISGASLPSASITNAVVSGTGSPGKPNGTSVPSGGAIPDTTPTLTITLGAALPPGYQVRVFQDGTAIGTFSPCASPCTFTTPAATQGGHTYTVRTVAGPVNGALSGGYALNVDTVAPAQSISVSQVRSDVAPNSTVAGAIPANNLIASGGLTNDSTPIVRITLGSALAAGESVVIRRSTTQVASLASTNCGTNCYEASVASAISIVTNTAGGTTLPVSTGGGGFQTQGTVSYTGRVVDAAGNEGPSTAAHTVNVGYFLCHQNRANATYLAATGVNHTTISAGAAGATRCADCHNVAAGHPGTGGTPAGAFVAVPSSAPTYWCKRPS